MVRVPRRQEGRWMCGTHTRHAGPPLCSQVCLLTLRLLAW
jgi:hypothetical protein